MTELEKYLVLNVQFLKAQAAFDKGYAYLNIEEFVLKNGRYMGERDALSDKFPHGTEKECFKNAYDLAIAHNLRYVEGFAMGIIPVLHAWCLTEDGLRVIDPTWRDGTDYFGVEFDLAFATKTLLSRRSYGVIDNFEQRWPVLKNGYTFPVRR